MLDDTAKSDLLDGAIADLETLKKFRVDIERALQYGGHTHNFMDVCALVVSGKLDVHNLGDAAFFAEVIDYPQSRVYHVFIAVGNLDTLLEHEPTYLVAEARKRGAVRVTLAGRKGWKRVFEPRGWKHDIVLMSKEV